MMKVHLMVTLMTLAKADNMKPMVMKMSAELEVLQSTVKYLAEKNAELKAENFDIKNDMQKLKYVVTDMKAKDNELKAENFDLKNDIQKLKNVVTDMKAKYDELKKDFQYMNSELKVINDQLDCGVTEVVRDVSIIKNPLYYNLEPTHKYNIQRKTSNMRISYYVKESFHSEFTGNLRKLERQIEEEYIQHLRNACFREKADKENMLWQARYSGNSQLLEKANNIPTPSCNSLEKIYAQGG